MTSRGELSLGLFRPRRWRWLGTVLQSMRRNIASSASPSPCMAAPLLAGVERLTSYVRQLEESIRPSTRLSVGIQSNGTLYSKMIHDWAIEAGVSIGISLDGPPRVNDWRRVFVDGRGSASEVERALGLLRGTPVFSGLLAVIDPTADPVEMLRYLGQWSPPILDFLLPHGHWRSPPPHRDATSESDPVYGRWLTAVFDEWWNSDLSRIAIRTFEEIILRLAGRPGVLETLGTEPVTLVTIGCDGAYEGVDTLKSAFPGAHVLGMHIQSESLDDVLEHESVVARQSGASALSERCQGCPLVNVCGGGYLPHRLGLDGTFKHPSVYCSDLAFLIRPYQPGHGSPPQQRPLMTRRPGLAAGLDRSIEEIRRRFGVGVARELVLTMLDGRVSRIGIAEAMLDQLEPMLTERELFHRRSSSSHAPRRDRGKGGFCNRFADEKEAISVEPHWLLYVSQTPEALRRAQEAEESDDSRGLGNELRYPICCISLYGKVWEHAARYHQGDLFPIAHVATPPGVSGHMLLNFSANYFGGGWTSFFPCSLTCSNAIASLTSERNLVAAAAPKLAAAADAEARCAVVYTEYRGVTQIRLYRADEARGVLTYDSSTLTVTLERPRNAIFRALVEGDTIVPTGLFGFDIERSGKTLLRERSSDAFVRWFKYA